VEQDERRDEARGRAIRGAKIVFNNKQSVLDCVIRDISGTGARLRVDGAATLPERFLLRLPAREGVVERPVRVVWRSVGDVGVAFD